LQDFFDTGTCLSPISHGLIGYPWLWVVHPGWAYLSDSCEHYMPITAEKPLKCNATHTICQQVFVKIITNLS